MSYMDLESLIQSEGYKNIKCLWYWNPKYRFSHGLRPLNNDQDVMEFSKDVIGCDVYVEHNIEISDIVDASEIDTNIDGDDDVECIGFKTASVGVKMLVMNMLMMQVNMGKKEVG